MTILHIISLAAFVVVGALALSTLQHSMQSVLKHAQSKPSIRKVLSKLNDLFNAINWQQRKSAETKSVIDIEIRA